MRDVSINSLLASFLLLLALLSAAASALSSAAPPSDVQVQWTRAGAQLSWIQLSDADQITVQRCRRGRCVLLDVRAPDLGRQVVTDAGAQTGDALWIGEFRARDGPLGILGWYGPHIVPSHQVLLPRITSR